MPVVSKATTRLAAALLLACLIRCCCSCCSCCCVCCVCRPPGCLLNCPRAVCLNCYSSSTTYTPQATHFSQELSDCRVLHHQLRLVLQQLLEQPYDLLVPRHPVPGLAQLLLVVKGSALAMPHDVGAGGDGAGLGHHGGADLHAAAAWGLYCRLSVVWDEGGVKGQHRPVLGLPRQLQLLPPTHLRVTEEHVEPAPLQLTLTPAVPDDHPVAVVCV